MKPEDKEAMKNQKLSLEQEQELDKTWQNLTQDWQTQTTPETDIAALISHTRRRVRRAKYCFALNVFMTIFVSLYFIYDCIKGNVGEPFNIYLGFGSFICIIFVLYEWKIRSRVWRQYNESPDQAIDTAIENSKVSMRYLQISRWSIVPFIPLMNWYFYTVMVSRGEQDLNAYFVGNGLIFVMAIVFEVLYRKRKKEYENKLKLKTENAP